MGFQTTQIHDQETTEFPDRNEKRGQAGCTEVETVPLGSDVLTIEVATATVRFALIAVETTLADTCEKVPHVECLLC